jgi:hypothetical protein
MAFMVADSLARMTVFRRRIGAEIAAKKRPLLCNFGTKRRLSLFGERDSLEKPLDLPEQINPQLRTTDEKSGH